MRLLLPLVLALAAAAVPLPAQRGAVDTSLTIDRIFRRGEFRAAPRPSPQWLKDGTSYLETRANPDGGTDVVRVDVVTGTARVIADAKTLVDARQRRIDVEEISLSADESRALLFHSSVRVWRQNTRGLFHVLDFSSGKLTPVASVVDRDAPATRGDSAPDPMLGRDPATPGFIAPPPRTGLQMFAKFSPDARQVAFVSDNDLYVTDVATGTTRRLTRDGPGDIINGTSDWVYEEELDLRDAFRWSPDSRRIAYWRFDQTAVPAFPRIDELSVYPVATVLRYPKAGAPNSRVKVGVMDVATARTTWVQGPDTGIYLARMEWAGNDSVVVQRLPRRQNRVEVLMASATSGRARTVLTDTDSAWVEVDDIRWVDGGRRFLWFSDRSGWRQLYLHERSGRLVRQLTRDGADVISIAGVDEARGDVYVMIAAPTPTQRQLFAISMRRSDVRRLTPGAGTWAASIAPGARHAVVDHSSAGAPPTSTLYELPAFTKRRVLVDNAALRDKVAALGMAPTFFRMTMPDGIQLDAYRIAPANFDSTKKYPVLMYVYGGPASPTVNDVYGGTRYLWHALLAQRGYVVVSVDNRGAAWRGRDFRKVTYLHLGRHEARDQIDAAKWLARQQWVDAGRIGIWGWSYGGYMTALATTLGGTVFRAGVAVAPVTDWRLYDTIYTERFMRTPQENADGYRESSPLTHAAGLTARLLLVHGTDDDNVHFQNSIQLADRLEKAGKSFYLIPYPNLTHSLSGGTQAHLYGELARFVIENL